MSQISSWNVEPNNFMVPKVDGIPMMTEQKLSFNQYFINNKGVTGDLDIANHRTKYRFMHLIDPRLNIGRRCLAKILNFLDLCDLEHF